MWYYLVAVFVLTSAGQRAQIRSVGPFTEYRECEAARRLENPALWVGDECFDPFSSISPKVPTWFGRP